MEWIRAAMMKRREPHCILQLQKEMNKWVGRSQECLLNILSLVRKVSILTSEMLFDDDLFVFTVQVLLDYGADPNLKDGIGNTPLHLGKRSGCIT